MASKAQEKVKNKDFNAKSASDCLSCQEVKNMCNIKYQLTDWLDKPCKKCHETNWTFLTYEVDEVERDILRCSNCKTDYCIDCGDTSEFEKEKHKEISNRPLADQLLSSMPITELINNLNYKFDLKEIAERLNISVEFAERIVNIEVAERL